MKDKESHDTVTTDQRILTIHKSVSAMMLEKIIFHRIKIRLLSADERIIYIDDHVICCNVPHPK